MEPSYGPAPRSGDLESSEGFLGIELVEAAETWVGDDHPAIVVASVGECEGECEGEGVAVAAAAGEAGGQIGVEHSVDMVMVPSCPRRGPPNTLWE